MANLEAVKFVESYKLERFITDGLNNGKFGHSAVEILSEIYVLERSDVAPVVRCKDCKYSQFGKNSFGLYAFCINGVSGLTQLKNYEDDFCSYGERRNDAAD